MGKKPYDATFYELPLYFTINNMFYRDTDVVDSGEVDLTHWEKTNSPRKPIVSSSNSDFPNRLTYNYSSRILHKSASIICATRAASLSLSP
jgi:hypothetical protein